MIELLQTTLKSRGLPKNFILHGYHKIHIKAFVADNHRKRYPESLNQVTLTGTCVVRPISILKQRERIKLQILSISACNTGNSPRNTYQEETLMLPRLTP